jgi:methylated-DNA-[protein]-cysteine S-methyltransferase
MFVATYPSPVGQIVMESDGEALTALRFGNSGNETAPHSMPTQTIAVFDEVRRWLDEYFSGKRTENAVMGAKTDGRIAAKPKGTAFQQRVWQALLTIPY